MDRNLYLQLCQKVAVLPNGVGGIKKDVPQELLVVVDGITYYPQSYTIDFNAKGEAIHVATLHDLKSNSINKVKLERVKKYIDKAGSVCDNSEKQTPQN